MSKSKLSYEEELSAEELKKINKAIGNLPPGDSAKVMNGVINWLKSTKIDKEFARVSLYNKNDGLWYTTLKLFGVTVIKTPGYKKNKMPICKALRKCSNF